MPSNGALQAIGLDGVVLERGYWGGYQALNSSAILPHCQEWIERMGWVDNLRAAADGRLPGRRRGREFTDSDVYRLLEAMCWEYGRTANPELDQTIQSLGLVIEGAQEPDGYLNTAFGRLGQPGRYTDMEWGHELYCYGHLIQAGVARLRTKGDDTLTGVARRAADHICDRFGPDPSSSFRPGICGHPEIEMALVELYRCTGAERYLEQARRFVERRGHRTLANVEFGREYFQDDIPVRRAKVLAGHAVRALYLACGAVDVATETGDDELLQAIAEQWSRTVAARTYLTGGMGARHRGEAYGEDFELPPDAAYSETCAGVASIMLSWRLLLATGESKYADLIERTLYNVIVACPDIKGHAFFYTNPLQQRVPGHPTDPKVPSPAPGIGTRAPWFEVSCCPTNLARLLASLSGYVATSEPDGVALHQYASGTVHASSVRDRYVELAVDTDYPWSGRVSIRVDKSEAETWRLGLRVPAWASKATVTVAGESTEVQPGMAYLERNWRQGDEVVLEIPLHSRWTRPDPRIDAVRGCVAVERGPLVYCAESVDQESGVNLDSVAVEVNGHAVERPLPDLGTATLGLALAGRTITSKSPAWPYTVSTDDSTGEVSVATACSVSMVPYHLWANRGPSAMRIWIPAVSE